MKPLNQYETIGIALSIIVVVVILGVLRLFYFEDARVHTVVENASDIIVVSADVADQQSALASAIAEGSTDSGRITKLIVQDVALGTGREARVGDTVSVHYVGLIKDGQQFDSSYAQGAPFSFKVGTGEVIEGWERGIIGMKEGGKRMLVVPASMGYGNRAVGPVPPNATLVFMLELLTIE